MFQHGFTAEFGIMSIAVLTELLKTLQRIERSPSMCQVQAAASNYPCLT
jgi:hypothetical protein